MTSSEQSVSGESKKPLSAEKLLDAMLNKWDHDREEGSLPVDGFGDPIVPYSQQEPATEVDNNQTTII